MKKDRKNYKKIMQFFAIAIVAAIAYLNWGTTDTAIRSKVVRLTSPKGSCSGEQVMAPSGVSYIITAAHCRALGDEITATTEDGKTLTRKIIAEDPNSDLLLLEGIPGLKGLPIADNYEMRQHVRTFTHGHNLDTYKTEGTLVQMKHIDIPVELADSPELEAACLKAPKFHIEALQSFFGPIKVCVLSVDEIATTAQVEPGSSGGAVLDDSGKLVGIVSASGNGFGWLVPLEDITAFIGNY